MTLNQPTAPRWMFRGYQAALAVIALVYVLILVILIPTGLFIKPGPAIRLLGSIFLVYLAPGTFSLALAVGLSVTGQRPGPVIAGIGVLAALWTLFAGYTLVLT